SCLICYGRFTAFESSLFCLFAKSRVSAEQGLALWLISRINDPDVWSGRALQDDFVELAVSGLASMYPAFDWSIAPGHHGYQRACDLVNGQASTGHLGHQYAHALGRPNLHLASSSRRPRLETVDRLRHRLLLRSLGSFV
ncbi:MAG TPA: hypothetical protein VGI09_14570, partial [Pseudolabrys sp.]